MEYIFVHFDPSDIRDVLLDGMAFGQTEAKLMLQAGVYIVSLSGTGYTPSQWSGTIAATDPGNPLRIVFTPSGPPPVATAPAKPGKKRKKKKKKTVGV